LKDEVIYEVLTQTIIGFKRKNPIKGIERLCYLVDSSFD